MWTTVFIVHMPYFQHPETRDYWTQDMAYEWRTYPHPYTLIHDTSVTSVLKAYLIFWYVALFTPDLQQNEVCLQCQQPASFGFQLIYSNGEQRNFQNIFVLGYITQNRLSFSLKQGTKPDNKIIKSFLMHRILARGKCNAYFLKFQNEQM